MPTQTKTRDNDPQAAAAARARIAGLPDQYAALAMPKKSELVEEFKPVSPAAQDIPLKDHLAQLKSSPLPSAKPQPQSNAATSKPAPEPKLAPPVKAAPKPPASKRPRPKLPSPVKPLLTGIVTFIVLFLLFKSPIILNELQFLLHKQPAQPTPATQASATSGPDPGIVIPKLNVSAPIQFASDNVEADIQKALQSGVVHYAGTAEPGTLGNNVIFGHSSNDWWEPGNYKFVFVLLDKLQVGDTFTINYHGRQLVYQVVETKVVEPTDLSVVAPTPDAETTLITCTPPGTSWKRLIVRAKQLTPVKPQAQTASNSSAGGLQQLSGNGNSLTDQLGNLWQRFVALFGGSQPSTPSTPSGTLPAAN